MNNNNSFVNIVNVKLNKVTLKTILPLQIFNDYDEELTRNYNKTLFNNSLSWDQGDILCFNSNDFIWVD